MILNPITNRKVKEKGPSGRKIISCLKKEDDTSQEIILEELKKDKGAFFKKQNVERILDISDSSSFLFPNYPKITSKMKKGLRGVVSEKAYYIYIDFLSRKYSYLCFISSFLESISFNRLDDIEITLFRDMVEFPERAKNYIRECIKNKNTRFVAIPVGIKYYNKDSGFITHVGHANILIYDIMKKELEHYEPHRYIWLDYRFKEALKRKTLVQIVSEIFNKDIAPVKKYFSPVEICPPWLQKIQQKEIENISRHEKNKNQDEDRKQISGFCFYWCLFYLELRISNPHIKRKNILKIAKNKIEIKSNLTKFIQMYSSLIDYVTQKTFREHYLSDSKNWKAYKLKMNKLLRYMY